MKREDKTAVLAELVEEFRTADTLFVADYRGLDMPAITDLRNQLRGTEAHLRVVKNTLARIAAEEAGYGELKEIFVGPTAIAFVRGDVAAVAKVMNEVAKRTDILKVRGGLVEGRTVDEAQVDAIAKLPPREVVLAMFVGGINAPMSQTVGVLAAPMRDLVGVIDAYIQKQGGDEAAA